MDNQQFYEEIECNICGKESELNVGLDFYCYECYHTYFTKSEKEDMEKGQQLYKMDRELKKARYKMKNRQNATIDEQIYLDIKDTYTKTITDFQMKLDNIFVDIIEAYLKMDEYIEKSTMMDNALKQLANRLDIKDKTVRFDKQLVDYINLTLENGLKEFLE